MPRTCTICSHPQRNEIETSLLTGTPFRHIASRFDTSTGALQRHKQAHIPQALMKAQEDSEVAHARTLLDQVRDLQERAMQILSKAEESNDLRTAVSAIGQARAILELQGKATGELGPQVPDDPQIPTVINLANIIAVPKVSREWLEAQPQVVINEPG